MARGVLRREIFTDKGWRKVTISKEELIETRVLTIQVDRTWNPYEAGFSNNPRNLGVAIVIPEYN
jgi:hypothetical protein